MTEEVPSAVETPPPSAAEAQSREPAPPEGSVPVGDSSRRFDLGGGIERSFRIRPYRPPPQATGLPLFRKLRVFTSDPAASAVEGAVAEVEIPYEPLRPGPVGSVLAVDCRDGVTNEAYRQCDLDDRHVALSGGYAPSITDPRFHQQMVYAVATTVRTAFKRALGREPAWGFDGPVGQPPRLLLRPHALREENAYYDPAQGEIWFGAYEGNEDSRGRNLPSGKVFTCLSHDVITHEVTHALLDGLRSHFLIPSNRDVLAFHEGFADLVAIFQRFSYKQVVVEALRKAGGSLASPLLTDLAAQFGQTVEGGRWALRSALVRSTGDGVTDGVAKYRPGMEEHEAGAVFLAAMFEAFDTIYRRKTQRIVQLVTGGGQRGLEPDDLRPEVLDALADKAVSLSSQFLTLAIRAIDYCPPVDLHLGEYLRALITADRDVVPDDPWGYREAMVDAFRRRRIYPRSVENLSEEALLWRPARQPLAPMSSLRLGGRWAAMDGTVEQAAKDLTQVAAELGEYVTRREHLELFGLAEPGAYGDDWVDPPRVESVRPANRVGPDGQLVYDVVAEITQRRRRPGSGRSDFLGGATLILGHGGAVRYVIAKSVTSAGRLAEQDDFVAADAGRLWERTEQGRLGPGRGLLAAIHRPRRR